ncbi:MAG: nucleotide exchange factor GrpE, partial [Alphaproteobacteria bacterium]|nr:nucleotide exchange factor GrpE [Alphaproteobacteria bacterium]
EEKEAASEIAPETAQNDAVEEVLKEVLEGGADITSSPPLEAPLETPLEAPLGVSPLEAPLEIDPTLDTILKPAEPSPEEQIAALNDQLLRALAEIENTRRRGERDRAEALKYGAVNFARDILSVADNLRRALASLDEEKDINKNGDKTPLIAPLIAPLIEGVTATERELQAILQRHHITIIDPKGEKFDPNRHEALFEVPQTNTQEAGIIMEVVEVGYMLDDRLLRPAKVGISKAA